MSSKSSKASQSSNKKTSQPEQKVGFPKRIDLKPDHLHLLKGISGKEKAAGDKITQAYLRIRQIEQQREKLQQQVTQLEREILNPQEQEVYRQRKRLIETAESFMNFYDLPQREGLTWQLTVDEGAWILVPAEQNQ